MPSRYIAVAMLAVGTMGAAVALFLVADYLLPPELQRRASWIVGIAVVGTIVFLGSLSEFTGIRLMDLVDAVAGRRRDMGHARDELRAQRDREAMLQLVRNTWVKGVLEQSLHGAALLALGMEVMPGAVEHPWKMVLHTSRDPHIILRRDTRIVEVFEEMNRGLLILGEPGSGKTTTLLELARDTIARAETDPGQPIPVVFNLSSWREKQKDIADWLVDEFREKYNAREGIARPWVENDDLLLLLDGLDELQDEPREACLEALNDFRREHGFVGIAVCCRTQEYKAMNARLRLHGAVSLQPLADWQVDEFLARAENQLLPVHQALERDTTLRLLARSPLFLNVITLAYRGVTAEDLGILDSIEDRRIHLLRAYVQRMHELPRGRERYSREESIRWLAWLARRLSDSGRTIFLVERMQPSWLEAGPEQRLYRLASLVTPSLLYGVPGGLVARLFLGGTAALITILVAGMVVAVAAALVLDPLEDIRPTEVLNWSWRSLRISMRESLTRSGPRAALVGGVIGAVSAALAWLADPSRGAVVVGLVIGLVGLTIGALSFLLVDLLFESVTGGLRESELETTTYPNQGIRRSARNAAIASLLVGLTFASTLGLVAWLPYAAISEPGMASSSVLWAGCLGGVFGLLYFGGDAVFSHFAIRFILRLHGHVPSDYVRFLDSAAECILLRKIGGGYVFIHRVLQDYFAGLEAD